jgi:hypothetical protein
MSQEMWQWLWNRRADTSPTPEGNPAINEWLEEIMTEDGYCLVQGEVRKLSR